MTFSDKINFLFELTHAEGRELAAVLSVTPPQISKMRNGNRGLPKNRESAWLIANFFAKRSNSDFQRDVLAKKIRLAQIRTIYKESDLTDILLDWLGDEQAPEDYAVKRAEIFLSRFGTADEKGIKVNENVETQKTLHTDADRFFNFYGNEGRRKAVLTFLQYLIQRGMSYTVHILTDERTDWVLEDPSFSAQLQENMVKLVKQGCTYQRICGPLSDMDQAFESLNRWFPLYMSGKATSYYYNRMRDNLNRVTIFAVEEVAVLFSFSVGNQAQSEGVTFFTTDKDTVGTMMKQFENYLSQCEPIMKVYGKDDTAETLHKCLVGYENIGGSCIHRSNSLPFITLPWEVATSLRTDERPKDKQMFLASFAQRFKIFMSNVEKYTYTDIIKLADIDDIMNGSVPIPVACIISSKEQNYSPKAYLKHLNNILFLLEQKENYNVVLMEKEPEDKIIVYVKEGFGAILIREHNPFSIFEVSERNLVDAFSESLYRMIPSNQSKSSLRRENAQIIREFAAKLEQRILFEGRKKE